MKYRVQVYANASASVEVEAESREEARDKAFYSDLEWSYDDYDFQVEEVKDAEG